LTGLARESDDLAREDARTEVTAKKGGHVLPFPPKPPSSAVDIPPYYYGGEFLYLSFSIEEERARMMIPQPLEMGDTPGEGAIWFGEWVLATGSRPECAFTHPGHSLYRGCCVSLRCQHRGADGFFVLTAWTDNQLSSGPSVFCGDYEQNPGRVFLTRLHELNPRIGGRRVGAKVKGVCEIDGERLVNGSLCFTGSAEPSEIPQIKFYFLHSIRGVEDPSRTALCELCTTRVSEMRIADVWAGEADVTLGESAEYAPVDLGTATPHKGFYFSMGVTVDGNNVLYKYV
jgi:hypothetical protein